MFEARSQRSGEVDQAGKEGVFFLYMLSLVRPCF